MVKVGGSHKHNAVMRFANSLYNATLGKMFGKWNLKVKSKPEHGSPKDYIQANKSPCHLGKNEKLYERNVDNDVQKMLDGVLRYAETGTLGNNETPSFADVIKVVDAADKFSRDMVLVQKDVGEAQKKIRKKTAESTPNGKAYYARHHKDQLGVKTKGKAWRLELDKSTKVKEELYRSGRVSDEDMSKRLNTLGPMIQILDKDRQVSDFKDHPSAGQIEDLEDRFASISYYTNAVFRDHFMAEIGILEKCLGREDPLAL